GGGREAVVVGGTRLERAAGRVGGRGTGACRAPKRIVARPQHRSARAASVRLPGPVSIATLVLVQETCSQAVHLSNLPRWGIGLAPLPPSAIMVSAAVRRFVTVCAVIRLVGPLAAQGVQAP